MATSSGVGNNFQTVHLTDFTWNAKIKTRLRVKNRMQNHIRGITQNHMERKIPKETQKTTHTKRNYVNYYQEYRSHTIESSIGVRNLVASAIEMLGLRKR